MSNNNFRIISIFMALITLMLVTACGTKESKKQVLEDVTSCNFPDSPSEKAPLWVCDPTNIAGYDITNVGSYQKSAAGYEFSQNQATLSARTKIAQQISTKIESDITNSITVSGNEQQQSVEALAKTTSRSITDQILVGSKAVRSVTNSLGTVYVLVGIDKESYKSAVKAAVVSSYQQQPDIWKVALGPIATFEDFQNNFLKN